MSWRDKFGVQYILEEENRKYNNSCVIEYFICFIAIICTFTHPWALSYISIHCLLLHVPLGCIYGPLYECMPSESLNIPN